MSTRKIIAFLFTLLLCIAAVVSANAQQQTAQLTGRITDSSGAAIPDATVVVANHARGIKVVVNSDARGAYVAPLLPPADGYEITVSRSGFTQARRDGITLQVAQVAQ